MRCRGCGRTVLPCLSSYLHVAVREPPCPIAPPQCLCELQSLPQPQPPFSSPGPAPAPGPPWLLHDKVIQRQPQALISGLNPVSAGAFLSLQPLPALLSACPACLPDYLAGWLSPKLSVFSLYYCWLLDNVLLEAIGLFLFFNSSSL